MIMHCSFSFSTVFWGCVKTPTQQEPFWSDWVWTSGKRFRHS